MTRRLKKHKAVSSGDNDAEVSMIFPNQSAKTQEFLLTTVEAGPSSITTTRYTATTHKRQTQPPSIDDIPTKHLEEGETPMPVDGTPTLGGGTQVRST